MNYKQIASLVALTVLIVILGIALYTINDLNVKYGIKKITTLPRIENDFVIIDTFIYAERRADYIFPTDTLFYVINWQNKLDYQLEANLTIDGTVGESKSFEQPKMFSTILNQNGVQNTGYNFSLDKEGKHKLKLHLQLLNYTNKVVLDTLETPISTIEVLSRSNQLQENSNFWTIIGVLISSSIAGIAVFTSMYEIKSSRDERKLTLRPWISLGETKPSQILFQNLSAVRYEEWSKNTSQHPKEIKSIKINMEIKNVGTIPAFNIRRKSTSGHHNITRSSFNDKETTSMTVLMSGATQHSVWEIPWEEWRHRLENPIYLGILVEYDMPNTKSNFKTGLIVQMGFSGSSIIDSWIE